MCRKKLVLYKRPPEEDFERKNVDGGNLGSLSKAGELSFERNGS